MPYIAPKNRKNLDPHIDALAEAIVSEAKQETRPTFSSEKVEGGQANDAAFAGLLNYSVTRLALKIIKLQFGKVRYWIVATITGTFKNIADEFYRRLAAPYEDKQIKANGDVDLYEEMLNDMKK